MTRQPQSPSTSLLAEARCLISSAAYSIPRGTFAAQLWLFDAEKWLAAMKSKEQSK